MKLIAGVALAAAVGFLLWQRGAFSPPPPPPPPPPEPPQILTEPVPVIGEEELEKVLKSAQDTEANVRWEAVVFLDKVKSPRALPLMQNMLRRDPEAPLRIKIVNLLSDRKGPEVMQTILGALKDTEPEVRLAALHALDKIGDFSIASAISEGPIRDQDDGVRVQALKTLNSLQDKKQREIDAARKRYEEETASAAAAAAGRK